VLLEDRVDLKMCLKVEKLAAMSGFNNPSKVKKLVDFIESSGASYVSLSDPIFREVFGLLKLTTFERKSRCC
jgi:hypothetical protein